MSENTDWFTGFGDLAEKIPAEQAVLLIADCCKLLDEIKNWPVDTGLISHRIRREITGRRLRHVLNLFDRDVIAYRLARMLDTYLRDRPNA